MNNGRMKESQEGTATLDDVDEACFIGFCQFAHRRDCDARSADVENDSVIYTNESRGAKAFSVGVDESGKGEQISAKCVQLKEVAGVEKCKHTRHVRHRPHSAGPA